MLAIMLNLLACILYTSHAERGRRALEVVAQRRQCTEILRLATSMKTSSGSTGESGWGRATYKASSSWPKVFSDWPKYSYTMSFEKSLSSSSSSNISGFNTVLYGTQLSISGSMTSSNFCSLSASAQRTRRPFHPVVWRAEVDASAAAAATRRS